MLTAAEGQELYDLVREGVSPLSDAYARLRQLAERVAHDTLVEELSGQLGDLCNRVSPDGDNSPELMDQIRALAHQLADLAPPELKDEVVRRMEETP